MKIDQKARYMTSHEWARQDDQLVTVGISDYAQDSLGDIVFVELPKVGTALEKGGILGVVESVKAASDIYSPVAGQVVAVNQALVDNPSLVNQDAFGQGWLVTIKSSATLDSLMDAAAYQTYCQGL